MKAMRPHRVPLLCRRAVEILDRAQMFGGGSPLVFTHGGGQLLYDKQLRSSTHIPAGSSPKPETHRRRSLPPLASSYPVAGNTKTLRQLYDETRVTERDPYIRVTHSP